MTAPGSPIPALVPVAMEVFDAAMPTAPTSSTEDRERRHSRGHAASCTRAPRTEAGVRENIRVGVQYLAAWLGGRGAVPLYNLMEDAATAEICRTQLWQWLQVRSAAGRRAQADARPVRRICSARKWPGSPARRKGGWTEAEAIFAELVTAEELDRVPDPARPTSCCSSPHCWGGTKKAPDLLRRPFSRVSG